MNSVTRVQTLDEAVCISHSATTFQNDINTTIPLQIRVNNRTGGVLWLWYINQSRKIRLKPPSQQALENADYVLCRVVRPHLNMTLNCSSGALGSVEYVYTAITPRFTMRLNSIYKILGLYVCLSAFLTFPTKRWPQSQSSANNEFPWLSVTFGDFDIFKS